MKVYKDGRELELPLPPETACRIAEVFLTDPRAERLAAIRRLKEAPQLIPDPRSAPSSPLGERNSRTIPQAVKIKVSNRDQGRCRQCGSEDDLHFDHVIPWSRGGANTVKNVQLLCGRCNRIKGDDDIPV
jgi:5-methylcytosine-specific restriction endonuclease McrA